MDNKSDLFDLKKEKQELDNFLSTIAGTEAPVSTPVKESAPMKEPVTVKEAQPEEKITVSESPRPRPLASATPREEAFIQPAYIEKSELHAAEIKPEIKPEIEPEIIPVKPVEEPEIKPRATSSFLPAEEKREEPLPKVTSAQEAKAPESEPAFASFDKPVPEAGAGTLTPEGEKFMALGEGKEHQALEEALYEPPRVEKKTGKGKQIGLLVVLVIVLLAGAFWMYSGQIANSIKSIPGVDNVIKNFVSVDKDIHLINVRTRLVDNKKIGRSIRVIEGVASNVSTQTISNIKITARLKDAGGAELTSMDTLAGNILIDEKLENLDAGAIKAALQAVKGTQDKIPPNGQIPFMIVFTSEPAGVFKMSVTPVDFTKN